MIGILQDNFHRLIRSLSIDTKRFLYADFSIKNRLTGIVGPRGVGKTTLMLQYIKEHLYESGKAFYFTADHVYFNQTTLLEFVTRLYSAEGMDHIFIDEIHKYKNWNQELKNIYDSFPDVKIIFSGSSSLDLIKGGYDLSRRVKLYTLPGFSFREYLNLKQAKQYLPIRLEDLLAKPAQFNSILSQIPKALTHFKEYLHHGYYPFAMEDEQFYEEKIIRIIEKTLYEDIAEYYNLKTENLHYLKRLLSFLASIPPGEINTNNIAKNLGVDHKTAFNFMTMLQETGLVRLLFSVQTGNRVLTKPEKMYLHNASLYHALGSVRGHAPVMGTLREVFLLQSLADAKHPVHYSSIGDFLVHDLILEVGGKNKTSAQLKKIETPKLLVKDEITSAISGTVPLYYFGFLY